MKRVLMFVVVLALLFTGCLVPEVELQQVVIPTVSPDGESFIIEQEVTISTSTAGATIYYTTDESEPTTISTEYTIPFTITEDTTVKAFAVKTGLKDSTFTEITFTRAAKIATPTINPNGGNFVSSQEVTINCATTGATIYYTTDGNEPTTSSNEYSTPFTINSSCTVKALAAKESLENSTIASIIFTRAAKVATPTINPEGGNFVSSQEVTLSSTTVGSTIYYTTDGNEPTTSNEYTSPFTITADTTVKAFAVKSGLEDSNIESINFAKINIPSGFEYIPTADKSYTMGWGKISIEDEINPHEQSFTKDIFIGKYEVTQNDYDLLMKQPGNILDSSNYNSTYGIGDNFPAYNVSWYEAVRYCNELSIAESLTPYYTIDGTTITIANQFGTGYRLPFEAEWEYCAKGGDYEIDGRPTCTYSGSNTIEDVAWYSTNSGSKIHEVGTKAANSFGLYDMSGNLNEWCYDRSANYTTASKQDYTGASAGSFRVHRGGYWSLSESSCRSVHHSSSSPFNVANSYGFRLCRYL